MDLASQFIYSAITGCNVFCFLQVKHDWHRASSLQGDV
jgi:hypothetical protein